MRKLSDSRQDRVFADWLVHRAFLGHTLGSHDLDAYLATLARSVDYAVVQYELARECVNVEGIDPDGTQILARVSAVNYLETCVVVSMRSLRCLERLSSNKNGVAISRVERRLAQRVLKQLEPVRNTIEHLDNAIRKGEVRAGDPHALAIDASANTALIGRRTLDLDDLHRSLIVLRRIARELTRGARAGFAA